MTARAGREPPQGKRPAVSVGDEGSERYMWAYPEGDHVVLSIPGLRDLELSGDDARIIGEELIATADELETLAPRKPSASEA